MPTTSVSYADGPMMSFIEIGGRSHGAPFSDPDNTAEASSSERSFVVEPRALIQQDDVPRRSVAVGRAGAHL
jgi:hypothetical protein